MMKPTLLIIDDSPVMSRFLKIFFSRHYDVTVSNNTHEALALLKSGFEPEAVVTDLEMPGLSGIAFIEAIRSILPATPLFVVSGLNESKFRLASLQAGADDFLPKPFHPAELEIRLNKAIAKKMQPVAAEETTGTSFSFSWLPSVMRPSLN